MPKNMKKPLNKPISEMQVESRVWARLRENYFTDGGSGVQTANFKAENMKKVIKIFKDELKISNIKSKKEIEKKIKEIEADDRFQAPPAIVDINAPLALVQVDLKAKHNMLKWVLAKEA